jgi:hypothetical protein
MYYRCRSTAGGQPPCPGVCFAMHETVKLVVQALADRQTYRRPRVAGPDAFEHVSEFCYWWFSLDVPEQEKRLSQVLEKVVFDPEDDTLEVVFDRAGMLAFIEAQSAET